jgi:steroid 5-alpha reductase family enzyme
MGLILLFTLPIAYAWRPSAGPSVLGSADLVLALLMIALIALEFTADQQQWNFQREKHRRLAAGEDLGPVYGKGFVHTGLWGLSRHPNYACEQSIWVVFYLFTGAATGEWLNASIVGCILLILLFHGSANFSEGISAGKYPDYSEYIKKVRRFI